MRFRNSLVISLRKAEVAVVPYQKFLTASRQFDRVEIVLISNVKQNALLKMRLWTIERL